MTHRIRPIHWRIASAYILLIVCTLVVLSLVLLQLLRTTYLRTLESGIAGQARLVAAIADTRNPLGMSATNRATIVQNLHNQLGARVTLIGADGTVLADSPQPAATSDNLLGRPEVHDALSRGQGESQRSSVATGDEMFYVAVPIGSPGTPTGVARVGVPLTTIAQAQTRLAVIVLAVALLATVVALALAIVIARHTTQPLLELRSMATRLASGDLDVQVPTPPDEEVAALAQDFNVMASRLRQLLATVETERQRLATVLATMVDGILMIDRTDTVTLVNRAAERLVSVSATALPLPLAAIPIGEGLLPAVRVIQRNQADATPLVIDEIIAPATRRSLRAVVTPLPTPEQTQALIVLQDLTDLRRAEQAQRTFLMNISHDLRTPLASLQAMIETLQDGALDDRTAAEDFLSRMDAEIQGLSRLVNELLELSRLESGQLSLHPAPTDLAALLTAVARRMTAQAQQRGVTINVLLPATMPTVMIDGARIEQVLLNLLQNALTFTPHGGHITLSITIQDHQIAISVQDTGIGIAPEDLPHIFDRFYKVDRARSGGGTGLGLAIAKHLVERHNGHIQAESKLDQGTIITFTLPRR